MSEPKEAQRKWHRRLRFLHFLEVAGDLLGRWFWRGCEENPLEIIKLAWMLTYPKKEKS